jgi:hypothetical protein
MQHKEQNAQIELLATMALHHPGTYFWNATPISDSGSEDPSFFISRPEDKFHTAALAAARRRDNALLLEPFDNPRVKATEYRKNGPRNPYKVPSSTPEYEGESEGIRRTVEGKVGPKEFAESFGSGEATANKLFAMLDAMLKKKRKRQRDERAPHGPSKTIGYVGTSGVQREEDEGEDDWQRERDRVIRERPVAGDRSPAFDVSPVMPHGGEILRTWQAWLYSKIHSQSEQRPQLDRLKTFLDRVKAGRRFGDLNAKEKSELRGIVVSMVEAEAEG